MLHEYSSIYNSMEDIIEEFPYPHFFDKPEQIFVPRNDLTSGRIRLFLFKPYIPRSVADKLDNCYFRDYNPIDSNLSNLYSLSRLYTHLFDTHKQYDIPLKFMNHPDDATVSNYMTWLLKTNNINRHHYINNTYPIYDAIHMMQCNVQLLNESLKHYHVPPDKIPEDYAGIAQRKHIASFNNDIMDPLATTIASLRYYFKLNGHGYQVLSDDRFISLFLRASRGEGIGNRIYLSNIDGEWYYDTKSEDLINNVPVHPIDEFPDGTVFVTAFDRREVLIVLDALDYASNRRSYAQVHQASKAFKDVIKDKSMLDNTIGKYVIDESNWLVHNIYLKKENGKLVFAYYR